MLFNRHAVTGAMELRLMSKSELAVAAQLSLSYLSELLSGEKTNPSPKAIRQLADALEVDTRVFYFRVDPEQLRRLTEDLAATA